MESVGLATVACYLSIYFEAPLPHTTIFLGEVSPEARIYLPTLPTKEYLDLCIKEGFNWIVGPSNFVQAWHDYVKEAPYQGLTITGLDTASDIVLKVFRVIKPSPLPPLPVELHQVD